MTAYFEGLSAQLIALGVSQPVVVVDLDRYRANIKVARGRIGAGLARRIVAKSLPSLSLIDMAMEGLETDRLMTFSDDMLMTLLTRRPEANHLLGKPFPVKTAARVLETCPAAADRVIWLVDTVERIGQYAELAQARGVTLSVALEVDVGLHRGGVRIDDLSVVRDALAARPELRFAGVMGYEPHLAKLKGGMGRRESARVDGALARVGEFAKALRADAIVNSGGSMTFSRYSPTGPVNEVALGSVLVKPTDFDGAGEAFQPAAFIATPILKYLPHNPLPAMGAFRQYLGRAHRAQIAIWGGYWKGRPVYPEGYSYSRTFGHSSNQEVWSGPELPVSPVDGFAFLRPTQSEAVLAELGPILALSGGGTSAEWLEVLRQGQREG